MKVILRDDVVGLGDIGQQVSVKAGYARNYLIPRNLAVEAGSKNAPAIAHQMTQIEKRKKDKKVECEKLADSLRDLELIQELRVASGGKVFGSVTSRMLAESLRENGYELDRRRVLLGDPIKKIGVHFVEVKLHPEVTVQVKVNVKEKEATPEEESQEALEFRENIEESSQDLATDAEVAVEESDSPAEAVEEA